MPKKPTSLRFERTKARKRKKIALMIILPILFIGLGITAYGAYLYNKTADALNDSYKPLDRDARAVVPKVDNVSILIIGVDDSDKRGFSTSSRSDALILATFNKDAKSIKLLSIPRDSYVYIPSKSRHDKINHAHAYGGPKATIETVEYLLDIPIDYYVKLNFNAFIEIVDALGGIEVEVPYTFSEQDSHDRAGAITLEEGLQHLNGEEALALARTRKKDSDFERGKRQLEIIKALIDKAISVGSISKYGNVIDAVGRNMETDLSFNHVKSFFNYVTAGPTLDIETLTFEGEDLWIPNSKNQRIYYYGIDETSLLEVKSKLQAHLNLGSTSYGTTSDSQSIEDHAIMGNGTEKEMNDGSLTENQYDNGELNPSGYENGLYE